MHSGRYGKAVVTEVTGRAWLRCGDNEDAKEGAQEAENPAYGSRLPRKLAWASGVQPSYLVMHRGLVQSWGKDPSPPIFIGTEAIASSMHNTMNCP